MYGATQEATSVFNNIPFGKLRRRDCQTGHARLEKPHPASRYLTDCVVGGEKVEVRVAPNWWREVVVVYVARGIAAVHYVGFGSQFDEEARISSGRPREPSVATSLAAYR